MTESILQSSFQYEHHEMCVLIEAMACGKPCIATSCGGPEYIIDNVSGILTTVKDIEGMAGAMVGLRTKIGRYNEVKIRNSVIDRFGSEKLVERLGNLYEDALQT